MTVTKVENTSDQQILLWYGHTSYVCPANNIAEIPLPKHIAVSILKHESYKDLKIYEEPTDDSSVEPPKLESTDKPWEEDPEWDPIKAPLKEVTNYATENGLTFNVNALEDEDEEKRLRNIVLEHVMS